ncbi:radical SAM protein [Carboxydothermus ferrireducens]|uniref:Pyruvate formate lyase activating enzyme n=1 Tax=Carboxydothermus ferrireducens DSM 11255 TaxID=1119529 RepID=A0ABX2R978_9THEO|nr:radical SAM protein [Carboxydothermus ferrireducens]NYE57485.1 putative pyruvate formate lyase activating enzyme [Carboxydothermus ferrireducens DSM 11255]
MEPQYLLLLKTGELRDRVVKLEEVLKKCTLCPHNCQVNRSRGERGFCGGGYLPVVASYGPHFGEERVLVGEHGSGTIFFSHCTLKCVFCQNCEISQYGEGEEVTPQALAKIMLILQRRGCHNINLVSPTHYVPAIVKAVLIAAEEGLKIPLVYNTSGYENVETLRLLEGIVDIYMPDIKFGDDEIGKKYAKAPGYFAITKKAVLEMDRQVGGLKLDEKGVACRGVLIRHLILPENLAKTDKVLEFISKELSSDVAVNLMDQYWPAHKAYSFSELSRRITREEYHYWLSFGKKLKLNLIK